MPVLAYARLTELSKFVSSCLNTINNHVIKYCDKVYGRSGKNLFRSITNEGKILYEQKSRVFPASSLFTSDFLGVFPTEMGIVKFLLTVLFTVKYIPHR